jgi:hypothetical protein
MQPFRQSTKFALLTQFAFLFLFSPSRAQSADFDPSLLETSTKTAIAVEKEFLDYATDEQLTYLIKEMNGASSSCSFQNAYGPAGTYLGVAGDCLHPGSHTFTVFFAAPPTCENGDSAACRYALKKHMRKFKEANAHQGQNIREEIRAELSGFAFPGSDFFGTGTGDGPEYGWWIGVGVVIIIVAGVSYPGRLDPDEPSDGPGQGGNGNGPGERPGGTTPGEKIPPPTAPTAFETGEFMDCFRCITLMGLNWCVMESYCEESMLTGNNNMSDSGDGDTGIEE